MYFVYSLLLAIGFVVLIPRFLLDAINNGKYVSGFGERLGNLPVFAASANPRIWIHCVSVGETQAARPLIKLLRQRYPSYRLLVSTTTLTGQKVAREAFRDEADGVFYFPFDWAWTIRRALKRINPTAVLIMETELWPRLLHECRKRRIPVSIVNGRISNNSFRRYLWIRRFITRILKDLTCALMQSEQDAERIRRLGMDRERTFITGNLKFDGHESVADALTLELRERFDFANPDRLIIAASTHDPEEELLIAAFRKVRATPDHANVRLLIAPRHPERFSEVATILARSGFSFTRRSQAPSAGDRRCDVVLLDSVGELRALYPLANLVFVGGSIAHSGGHNVLEPAAHGAAVITGAHTSNFSAIISALLDARAIIQLPDLSRDAISEELATTFSALLADKAARHALGERARALCASNRGATQRTIELLESILDAPQKSEATPSAFTGHAALFSK